MRAKINVEKSASPYKYMKRGIKQEICIIIIYRENIIHNKVKGKEINTNIG